MRHALLAIAALAVSIAGCAGPSASDTARATTARITKVVPVVIESDKAPGLGSALAPKTANRPGLRITALTSFGQVLEVTQDAEPAFTVGETVRVEGVGVHAKFVKP